MPEPLLDPDCRDGKCGSCVGGPCEHWCHTHAAPERTPPDDTEGLREQHRRDLAAVYAERDEMWERKVAALRERDEARRELERLQAAIERVRAVHVVSDIGECTDCRASWPCPTVAALDGGE